MNPEDTLHFQSTQVIHSGIYAWFFIARSKLVPHSKSYGQMFHYKERSTKSTKSLSSTKNIAIHCRFH